MKRTRSRIPFDLRIQMATPTSTQNHRIFNHDEMPQFIDYGVSSSGSGNDGVGESRGKPTSIKEKDSNSILSVLL